ncbi:transposase [bacterium]|nr:transposase [bacterium]
MGAVTLEVTATDGTRIQADSSRYQTKSAAEIETWLKAVDEQIGQSFQQMATNDAAEDKQYGPTGTPAKLPAGLRQLVERKQRLEQAHAAVVALEQRRAEKGEASPDKIAKVPLSDPDARILENKEGGFAANYTPVITTDGASGLIIDAEVTNSTAEAPIQTRATERIEEMLGQPPQVMMGDGLYGELAHVRQLQEKGIEVLTPVKATAACPGEVAYREDPKTAVAEQDWAQLPRGQNGRLTRAAFLFDRNQDCFYCPLGKMLSLHGRSRHKKVTGGQRVTVIYKSNPGDCRHCPLKESCLVPGQKYRRIERMEGSEVLDQVAAKMTKPEKQALFWKRKIIAETPFGHIKHTMGIRRFRLRGLPKVQIEFLWICLAYNVAKLSRLIRSWPRCKLARVVRRRYECGWV